MEIVTNKKGDEIVIKFIGAMDIDKIEPLWGELTKVVLLNPKSVTVDLSLVPSINSSGIGKILVFYKELNRNSASFKIKGIQKNVYSIFKSAKLESLFPITMG